jgi:hypothetical protein
MFGLLHFSSPFFSLLLLTFPTRTEEIARKKWSLVDKKIGGLQDEIWETAPVSRRLCIVKAHVLAQSPPFCSMLECSVPFWCRLGLYRKEILVRDGQSRLTAFVTRSSMQLHSKADSSIPIDLKLFFFWVFLNCC